MDVSPHALDVPDIDSYIGLMHTLFTLEDLYGLTVSESDEDVITTPKTKKSNRMIKMPKFLCEEMQEYLQMLYGLKKKDRIFTVTKNIVEVYI